MKKKKESKLARITERQFDIILRAGISNDQKDIAEVQRHLEELVELYKNTDMRMVTWPSLVMIKEQYLIEE